MACWESEHMLAVFFGLFVILTFCMMIPVGLAVGETVILLQPPLL